MDLTTTYLGLKLKSPLAASASPLSREIDNIKKLEDHGASMVVMHSLYEEQITGEQKELEYHTTRGTESFPEALSYFPDLDEYKVGPDEYLNHIRKAKQAVKIPIVASLNGSTMGGWTSYAKELENAGADAIELNIYYIPTSFDMTGLEVENKYIEILEAVKSSVEIPVSVKLSPYFSNMANMAKRLTDAGANGLVLFNRFYQPDIDLDELEVVPNILLSRSQAMRLPMRWIAILKGRLDVDFAATSGINSGYDVLKMMMVGANVTMLCSTLLKHKIEHIRTIEHKMLEWMEEKEYESIRQMQGSMCQLNVGDPSSFERAQYMKALTNYQLGSEI